MPDEQLKMLLRVFGSQMGKDEAEVTAVTKELIDDTVKFRDKLKREAGIILTIKDTQAALDGLEAALTNQTFPDRLSSEQKALAQIYFDRMTLFKKS